MSAAPLRVFVTGADGFIGRALVVALRRAGCDVVEGVHSRGDGAGRVRVDFERDVDASVWEPRLAGVDVVVNTVGLLSEGSGRTFDAVHARAPAALFAACARSGVRRVIQISALGADAQASSAFHLSKKRADDALLAEPLAASVVQPSLVFGLDGGSARWLLALAAAPLIPLPGRGAQRIQPVHVDDVVDGLVALATGDRAMPTRVAMVGPEPLTLADYLARLRAALGFGPGRFAHVPLRLVRAALAIAPALGIGVGAETLAMLERGNVADAAPFASLLGRAPRAAAAFVPTHARVAARRAAQLTAWLPPLRASVSLLWLGSAFVSAFVFPRADSFALLGALGLGGAAAQVALDAGIAVDAALGIAVWRRRWRPHAYLLQILTTLAYSVLISVALPAFWAHPFAPLLKNVPLLVMAAALRTLDR
ncbi:MAG TPA: SDR family oxidoreductase [Dokdonella sp.]